MFLIWITIIFISSAIEFSSAQIQSSAYHNVRNNLQESFHQFNKGKKARVAFLGGSITYNPGWRDSTSAFIKRKFPESQFEFIAAGIPSMGSTPGAFRLERDILSKGKIDLLFVEAAVNDPTNGRSSIEQMRAMEGIIRHARKENPKIDIITMYFVDPDKMAIYNKGEVPEVIRNHEMVAAHYQVSSINLAREVTDRINAGEFSWKEDFKDLHPSPFGQEIYSQSIMVFLNSCWTLGDGKSKKRITKPLPAKIDEYCYDKGKLISVDHAEILDGWQIIKNWHPKKGEGTRKGYVDVPMLTGANPADQLKLNFRGRAIGLAVAAGPDAGMIEYSIDGADFKKLDLFTRWSSHLHLPWYYVLNAELSPGKHTLIIRISDENNPESQGNACRIKHFFTNK